jgi:redox-regulated HSP33 family molecular chaperone
MPLLKERGIYVMDVFTTIITAGGVILQFLGAYCAYADEEKSLKTRFDWDIRVLQVLNEYFTGTQALNWHLKMRHSCGRQQLTSMGLSARCGCTTTSDVPCRL